MVHLIASTIFSLLGAFVGLVIAVNTELDVITAFLIALGFVLGYRSTGPLDDRKTTVLMAVIIMTWIVSWIIFHPTVSEMTPSGVPWYYHNCHDIKADIAAISIGLIFVLYFPPTRKNDVLKEQ